MESLQRELTLAESWEAMSSSEYRCGDVFITPVPGHPDRYSVCDAHNGDVLWSGWLPPSWDSELDSLAYFHSLLDAHDWPAQQGLHVPKQGLGPWLEHVQTAADELWLGRTVERDEERPEALVTERIGRRADDILNEVPEEPVWLVPGVLVHCWAHKVAGREKLAGKGTLISYLLGHLERGEPTVFGDAPPQPYTALIYTEEPVDSLREKIELFGLHQATYVYGSELVGLSWEDKSRKLVQQAVLDGHSIVFVDNISRASGVVDENGVELARAAEVLADFCAANELTLIVDHHHKKSSDAVENKSRGGTALSGAMDVNLEIEPYKRHSKRARKITAIGRLRATNWEQVIELNAEGTDYLLVDLDAHHHADDNGPVDYTFVDQEWLRHNPNASAAEFATHIDKGVRTAKRRLNALVDEHGLATTTGTGRKGDPVRYSIRTADTEGA